MLFHPHLETSRVNSALARAAADAGIEVRDLYGLYPDGAIDTKAEQTVAEGADRVVFQFPLYWYSTPALAKQWQDDVLEYGWAYGSTGHALEGKELLVAVSLGAPVEDYAPEGAGRMVLGEVLTPLRAMANMVGMRFVEPFATFGAASIADDALAAQAQDYVERLLA